MNSQEDLRQSVATKLRERKEKVQPKVQPIKEKKVIKPLGKVSANKNKKLIKNNLKS